MTFRVQMPALGESVTQGTVTRWLKQEGETVERDEPLLEVATDKVDTEIPAPVSGVLFKILAPEDDTVEVGGDLAVITEPNASADANSSPPDEEPAQQRVEVTTPDSERSSAPNATSTDTSTEATSGQVVMPELGESVTEGTVTRWLKKMGESVALEEPIVEVSTDKVDTEIPSPLVGTLVSITVQEGDTVPVGGEMAVIALDGTASPENTHPGPTPKPEHEEGPHFASKERDLESAPPKGDAPEVPVHRRGSTHAGPKTESPNLEAADTTLARLRGTTRKASRIRQITAERTRESLQQTAQLTQTHEVDMTNVVALRNHAKDAFAEREGSKLTLLPFIAFAAIDALKTHPNINARYDETTKEITYFDAEHVGIAVDTERGLLTPVVHNAADLSLAGLSRAIADMAARARSGRLKPDELAGGTFTITNFGSLGALFDTPILVLPQAAMLGTGATVRRPRAIIDRLGNESIGIRWVCYLTLTYDHRLIDGADAGRFMTTVRRRLEEADFSAELGQ